MPLSVIPALTNALMDTARTMTASAADIHAAVTASGVNRSLTEVTRVLSEVEVIDGLGRFEPVGDYLMIGAGDPDAPGFETAAESEQEWAHANHTRRNQTGDISCAAISGNGDADQQKSRERAFIIAASVEHSLRLDPTLGGAVPGLLWAGYGDREAWLQIQDNGGATTLCQFQVHFRALI